MDNFIIINGVKIELTQDQFDKIIKAVGLKNKSPFDRAMNGETYYAINMRGQISTNTEDGTPLDDDIYYTANYCLNKETMYSRALNETLNRRLWRYSKEHCGDFEWDGGNCYYFIIIDGSGAFHICNSYDQALGTVYFDTYKTAKSALKEIVIPFVRDNPDFCGKELCDA